MGTRVQDDDRLLDIEDLARRWGVGEDVVRRHIKEDALPYVPLGRSAGKRPQYRFRVSAIQKWEADRERVREAAAAGRPVPAPAPGAGGTSPTWDGVDRTARGRKAGKPRPS